MLEKARQAEVTKNEYAAMAWTMFLEMARTDEALRVGTPEGASSSSGQAAPAVGTAAQGQPLLHFEQQTTTTIEHVVLKQRGPMTAAEIQAEVIFDAGMVSKFRSGAWPLDLASDRCGMVLYNEYGQAPLCPLCCHVRSMCFCVLPNCTGRGHLTGSADKRCNQDC